MITLQKRCLVLFAALAFLVVAMPALAEDAKKPAEAASKETPKDAKAAAAAAKGAEMVESGWQQRCNEPKEDKDKKSEKKICEIFQRVQMKETNMLVAEFAVGLPREKEKDAEKGAAHGVVILPLGILLEQGVGLKVDDKKPVFFQVRFCAPTGCFSFVNLNKELMASLKDSKVITFMFKTPEGQNVNLVMDMKGFDKALKALP